MYLEINAKLYILKPQKSQTNVVYSEITMPTMEEPYIMLYVANDTNSGAYSPNNECFIQTLGLQEYFASHTADILFFGNTASEQGANLFGGLLDRCTPSPFAEVYLKHRMYSGTSYFGNMSNLSALDTIAILSACLGLLL